MKRLISLLLTICMIWTLTSCGNGNEPTPTEVIPPIVPPVEMEQEEINHQEEIPEVSDEPFEGKIAIITDHPHAILSYSSALPIIDRYGEEKIIHENGPLNWSDQDEIARIVKALSNNLDVKVIIANPLFHMSISDFERLRETREDIFWVVCASNILWLDEILVEIADLILVVDEIGTGSAMVRQAYKMGAETFVHYSISQISWSYELIDIARRDLIEQECAELGIRFIEVVIPEAIRWNTSERHRFLRESMQRIVQNYGRNTAFFGAQMFELLPQVMYLGGIFPQPGHRHLFRSPFHIFDHFLYEDLVEIHSAAEEAIALTREFFNESGMLGRISDWPIPYEFLFTHAATEYAIKRLNGEVPKDGIDVDVLRGIMEDFAGVNVYLTPFTDLETGITHEHVLMMRMGYFIY